MVGNGQIMILSRNTLSSKIAKYSYRHIQSRKKEVEVGQEKMEIKNLDGFVDDYFITITIKQIKRAVQTLCPSYMKNDNTQ